MGRAEDWEYLQILCVRETLRMPSGERDDSRLMSKWIFPFSAGTLCAFPRPSLMDLLDVGDGCGECLPGESDDVKDE